MRAEADAAPASSQVAVQADWVRPIAKVPASLAVVALVAALGLAG